jgi:hypothetical protein
MKNRKQKHSVEILYAGSRHVGHRCPVTRTELKVGEQVIICHESDEAFSWSALPVLEGHCPYCRSQIDLGVIFGVSPSRSEKSHRKDRVKGEKPKPSTAYNPVRRIGGLQPSLILLFAIFGLLIGGIGVLAGYRYFFAQPSVIPTTISLVTHTTEPPGSLAVTQIASPAPTTAKPTSAPRSTSTPQPTPTTKPSSTPLPAPSPTPCTIAVGSRFTAAWNQYADELGCPLNQAHTHDAATQDFERGALLWRVKPDQIYVMYNDGRLEFYPMSAYPESVRQNPPGGDPDINPPSGYQQPVRGFGLIWRDNPQVREGLGWAMEGENRADWFYGFEAQDFVGGTIIHECRMGIRILLNSGQWIKISEGAPCG